LQCGAHRCVPFGFDSDHGHQYAGDDAANATASWSLAMLLLPSSPRPAASVGTGRIRLQASQSGPPLRTLKAAFGLCGLLRGVDSGEAKSGRSHAARAMMSRRCHRVKRTNRVRARFPRLGAGSAGLLCRLRCSWRKCPALWPPESAVWTPARPRSRRGLAFCAISRGLLRAS
jgi:hypothetical protein